ncbi:MAG: hypothetical protein HY720_13885 [Planctomycetes bacterium]|nr:hypothetical protein [Planctomycetota bacterium]
MDRVTALAIVSEAFSKRAHPNPWLDEPRVDRQILGVTDLEVRFREVGEVDAPVESVRYVDVSDLVFQDDEDVPSKTRTVQVHLRKGSPSAKAAATRSDLMTWIGVTDPYIVLPGRDRRLAARLEEAIDFLLDLVSGLHRNERGSDDTALESGAHEIPVKSVAGRSCLIAAAQRVRWPESSEVLQEDRPLVGDRHQSLRLPSTRLRDRDGLLVDV